jgi:hypothetical protein
LINHLEQIDLKNKRKITGQHDGLLRIFIFKPGFELLVRKLTRSNRTVVAVALVEERSHAVTNPYTSLHPYLS